MTDNTDQIEDSILLHDTEQMAYQMFILYFRGMENTGYETKNNRRSQIYDMSKLTKGVKCATQGCKFTYKITLIDVIYDSFVSIISQ